MSTIFICHPFHLFPCLLYRYIFIYFYLFSCGSVVSETWGLQQYAQYQCLGHGAATGRLKLMLLYITVYHLIFHAVLLLNNVF